MAWNLKCLSSGNTLADSTHDDVCLIGVAAVTSALAHIPVTEIVDDVVGKHRRVVGHEPTAVIEKCALGVRIVEQAARR